jgi:hypothetical protein
MSTCLDPIPQDLNGLPLKFPKGLDIQPTQALLMPLEIPKCICD